MLSDAESNTWALERGSGVTYGVVVICTKDRPQDLSRCLDRVASDRAGTRVVVVDASVDMQSRLVCAERHNRKLIIDYIPAERVGLARQRNQAVVYCQKLKVEAVHFIDDDTEIAPGYLDAIEQRFRRESALAGIGGIDEDRDLGHFHFAKWLFFLWGPWPSSVLRSGRVVIGQTMSSRDSGKIDWLSGCSMSYRMSTLRDYRFDDRLKGWSFGEDYDFGFRVSRNGKLGIERSARFVHHRSPLNRYSQRRFGYEATVLIYCWVKEHKEDGMSTGWFWWSVFGELLLRGFDGFILGRSSQRDRVKGIASGIRCIAGGRAVRSI